MCKSLLVYLACILFLVSCGAPRICCVLYSCGLLLSFGVQLQVAHYETEVEVLRRITKKGKVAEWVKVSCVDVVPGDVMKLKEDWKLPCDLVLV